MTTQTRGVDRPVGVRLAGTGMAVPPRVMTNDELATIVETNDEWITQRTGIKQRHVSPPDRTERHLGRDALLQAIENAKITPDQLDLVICATMTPEMSCPSTACRLVAEIGAVPAGAMDISAACSGFVYGLNLAWALITAGGYRSAAVVGAEVLSQVTNWQDRRTCVLFGDGAGAAVLTASDDPDQGCRYQSMASDGRSWDDIYMPRVEGHVPSRDRFNGQYNTLQMNGREVYKFAVTTLRASIDEALEASGLSLDDLAMIIPHQSNLRIIESVRDKLNLTPQKMYANIDRYGNTSAASVPICLHELWESQRIGPGDHVLFVALGGGIDLGLEFVAAVTDAAVRPDERVGAGCVIGDTGAVMNKGNGSNHGTDNDHHLHGNDEQNAPHPS